MMHHRSKRNRKVVITIKQQAADGTMVPTMLPQGALNALAGVGGPPSTGDRTPGGSNAQTVFRAQVQVDREK